MADRPEVRLKRIYEEPAADDGARVLVDRRWPRGVSKAAACLDEWCTAVAPSDALRRWYGHEPERFEEFASRYRDELADPTRASALEHLEQLALAGRVTLLTATRVAELSQAAVLVDLLVRRPTAQRSRKRTSPASRTTSVSSSASAAARSTDSGSV